MEMTRIQIWQLALLHVGPNLRSQRDYRAAMSRHFNLTFSLTLSLPCLAVGKASFLICQWEWIETDPLTDWQIDRQTKLAATVVWEHWVQWWQHILIIATECSRSGTSHNVPEKDPWVQNIETSPCLFKKYISIVELQSLIFHNHKSLHKYKYWKRSSFGQLG